MVRMNCFILSHDSVTWRRSPEVSSTAFDAQPPDLPPVSLMDMGFAIISPLARHRSRSGENARSVKVTAKSVCQTRQPSGSAAECFHANPGEQHRENFSIT